MTVRLAVLTALLLGCNAPARQPYPDTHGGYDQIGQALDMLKTIPVTVYLETDHDEAFGELLESIAAVEKIYREQVRIELLFHVHRGAPDFSGVTPTVMGDWAEIHAAVAKRSMEVAEDFDIYLYVSKSGRASILGAAEGIVGTGLPAVAWTVALHKVGIAHVLASTFGVGKDTWNTPGEKKHIMAQGVSASNEATFSIRSLTHFGIWKQRHLKEQR